jgi:hypothetical protein
LNARRREALLAPFLFQPVHLARARGRGSLFMALRNDWRVPMIMIRKVLLACAMTFAAALPALAQDRNPIVYNHQGNEVGVIQSIKPNGDAIMLPTQATLDLGYYDVVMPAAMLRPRERGGWETIMSNQDIAFLQPVPHRFFLPSGD